MEKKTIIIKPDDELGDISERYGIKMTTAGVVMRLARSYSKSEGFSLKRDGFDMTIVIEANTGKKPSKKEVTPTEPKKKAISAAKPNKSAEKLSKTSQAVLDGATAPSKIMHALDSKEVAYRDLNDAQKAIARSERSKRAAATAKARA